MKTVAIVIARMGSTRLPGKVLMQLGGSKVLGWVTSAARFTPGVDEVWVATSTLPGDDAIAGWCHAMLIPCFRGSETDVLSRVYGCAVDAKADVIVRVTGDCPFLDSEVIGQVIRLRQMTGADYASNIDPPTFPDGLDCEAFTFSALEAAYREAVRGTDRDCVTRFIARNRHRFKSETLICPLPNMHKERWVLDTENDLEFCKRLVSHLGQHQPTMLDILKVLDTWPELREINKRHPRNERFFDAVATEELPAPSFTASERWLKRARASIPLGAQTFSKSYVQYPGGPLFVSHGDGAYLFDADGNDFVDCVSGLMPIILGYRDPDVDQAIRRQLTSGISFSTSTTLEAVLAEKLIELIPCAEAVRFGKNGTDVTSAAVRVARAYTGKPHIILTGYHGWQDWSIGTTERNMGVPDKAYSHAVRFGDAERIKEMVDTMSVAAIIVEPNDNAAFLRWLQSYTSRKGVVLIFDEVITGFRFSIGGAQKFFNVTPDLATFGKAMANGMPLSAIVGRKDIMKHFEPPDNVFYSGTMFGESLSLAASIACIDKLVRENVLEHIAKIGVELQEGISDLIGAYKLPVIMIGGHPARTKITYRAHEGITHEQVKTIFMREMIRNGVLVIDSFNLTYSHREPECRRILKACDRAFRALQTAIDEGVEKVLGDTPVLGSVSVRAYEKP